MGQILLIEEVTGFEDIGNNGNNFYPNPAKDYVLIATNNLSSMFIYLLDKNGRIIKFVNLSKIGKTTRLDLKYVRPGIYLIIDNNGKLRERLIKL